ncbi:MAG: nuclear transport factor 2 family protein [Solirubrobacterales bacterium]
MTDKALAGYADFNSQDFDSLLARMTEDFSWHEAPEIPGPKASNTRAEFARYVRGFDQLWEEFHFEVSETAEGPEALYARVVLRGRGKASAHELELEIHHVWRLRDGLFASMTAYLDRDEARAAAGL